MEQNLQLQPCLLILFFFVLVFFMPASSSAPEEDQSHADCSPFPFKCGGVEHYNISYPFWTPGLPDYCGYGRDYRIDCNEEDKYSEIEIKSHKYHVKEIDYENQTATIVDKDFFHHNSCQLPSISTTLNFNLFNYTDRDLNLTFLYNCPLTLPLQNNRLFTFLPCLINENIHAYFTVQSDPGIPVNIPESLRACQVIEIPILRPERVSDVRPEAFWNLLQMGFQVTWTAIDPGHGCPACVKSDGYCGFNETSPQHLTCYCKGQLHPPTCASGDQKSKKWKIIIGVCAAVGGFILCLVFFFFRWYRNKRHLSTSSKPLSRAISSEPSLRSDLEKNSSLYATQYFNYKELEEATNNFDPSKELGDGGFGTVYYGKLHDGRNVAVKRLYENNYRRVEQFKNEINILSRLRHQNLVTLYGCSSRHSRELLLVYEFIPNGTVADHLHGDHAKPGALSWPTRMSIAIETADALKYLHAVEIIHRDVKTNNILLDNNFHVKVADFGLSRLFPTDVTHVSTAPQGTPGYVDPDYHRCYQLTDRSDVYSFGVVLIELISSKPAVDITRHRHEINLASMAISKIHNGTLNELVDPSLGFDSDYGARRMITLVAELAFRCLQDEKEIRPPMEEVLDVLRGIESEENKGEKVEEVDTPADEVVLLKEMPPLSPDTVTDAWESRTTTPNASG